jgi:hypothetical protein
MELIRNDGAFQPFVAMLDGLKARVEARHSDCRPLQLETNPFQLYKQALEVKER